MFSGNNVTCFDYSLTTVELYFAIKIGFDRGDMIETFKKILTGKYDALVSPTLNTASSW